MTALKAMALVNRGRLSMYLYRAVLMAGVQPVSDEAFEAIVQLGTKGGWDPLLDLKGGRAGKEVKGKKETPHATPKVTREGEDRTSTDSSNKRKSNNDETTTDDSKARRSKRTRKQTTQT